MLARIRRWKLLRRVCRFVLFEESKVTVTHRRYSHSAHALKANAIRLSESDVL
jgi:hypothetical protein